MSTKKALEDPLFRGKARIDKDGCTTCRGGGVSQQRSGTSNIRHEDFETSADTSISLDVLAAHRSGNQDARH
jgi:hypothetical protein